MSSKFVHSQGREQDTIAAIATAPGEGGVAIIRISGADAVLVANQVFSGDVSKYRSHTAHYGKVCDATGNIVDHALLLPMLGPRSYTGEDTVEIHCHGGSLITRRVLEVVLMAGARLAEPGEFTLRAYVNGRLDLTQAEAVQSLISAKNEHALDAASKQLEGALSVKVLSYQKELTQIAAVLEAWVDFPEEGLEFASMEETCALLRRVKDEMQALADTFHDGRILQDGLTLCIVGRPNVGKSSLMNALVDRDRAIVTPVAGTTRDVLEDHLSLNGLNLRLIDTAGVRESDEIVEQEGIRRSFKAMAEADLVLLVLDISSGVGPEDAQIMESIADQKVLVVWNKLDCPHRPPTKLPYPHVTTVSAKEGVGIDRLRQLIDEVIWEQGPPDKDAVVVTKLRHKESLDTAIEACARLLAGLESGQSPEFLSLDMRQCLQALGRIIGTDITEDILSAIFSTFCIGK